MGKYIYIYRIPNLGSGCFNNRRKVSVVWIKPLSFAFKYVNINKKKMKIFENQSHHNSAVWVQERQLWLRDLSLTEYNLVLP